MKKINRRVFIEFNGFQRYNNTPVIYEGNPVKLSEKNFNKILNFLTNRMISSRKNLKSGCVDIKSETLKKVVDNYRPYLSELEVCGYLEKDYYVNPQINRPTYFYKKYRKPKPYGYRFTETFKNWITIKRIIFIPLTDKEIIVKKEYDALNKLNKTKKISSIQFNSETIKRLKNDYNKCSIKSFNVQKVKYQRSKFIDLGKWISNQKELFKWNRGEITFNISSNRLYTNFTRLSSHVRLDNILLNNESVKERDVSNSFPLMLAVYCIRKQPEIVDKPDYIKYCNQVKSGSFYKELTDGLNRIRHADIDERFAKLKVKKGQKKDSTMIVAKKDLVRDVVKVLFQKYLNSDIDSVPFVEGFGNSLINNYMEKNYPEIHELVLEMKNNSKVYNELVEIESRFIFEIIEDLYKKDKDILLLTCHDAIYTTVNKFEELQEVFNNKIALLFDEIPGEVELNEESDYNEVESFADDEEGDLSENNSSTEEDMDYSDFDEEDSDFDDWWGTSIENNVLDSEVVFPKKSVTPERTYAEKLEGKFNDFLNEK